jgi:hypothetical protein
MTKIPAAILLAIGLTMGTAGTVQAQQPDETDWSATDAPDCEALTLSPDGKFDCLELEKPGSTRGDFRFMTWRDNGTVVESGYPVFYRDEFIRFDGPLDYDLCKGFEADVNNREKNPNLYKEYIKYDEVWCVKVGE